MANPEHLALIDQGPEAVKRFADDNPDAHLDLSQANFSGRDLHDYPLMGADLTGANLSRCDLREAKLTNANLTDADLRDADARGATFHHSNLTRADLRGLRLDPFGEETLVMCISPTTFQGTHWDRQRLERVLELLNLNSDWHIRYEITPKA
jgi:uncharacterized protein YjbI with pentapeptide repeats